jgi:hypothetical protein
MKTGGAVQAVPDTPREAQRRLLSNAYDGFSLRLSRSRVEIGNRLARLKPSERLEYLQSLMALHAPISGPSLDGDRLRRAVAAEYFPLLARQVPESGELILSLVLKYIAAEADPAVRLELIGGLGGLTFDAFVVLPKDPAGKPMPLVENLSPDPSASPDPSWHAGLRRIASGNGDALSVLGRISGDPKDPSRIAALRGLAGMNTEPAARILAAIWQGDPSCRNACADSIAETKRPELLEAFVQTLPLEERPRVILSMAKAIENSDEPPAGSSAALLAALRRPVPEDQGSGVLDMKSSLLKAAARIYSESRDPAAGECLSSSLNDSDPEIRARGLAAIATHPSPDLASALQQAASQDPSTYNRELAAFALRKGDPARRDPNVFWDLEQLQAELARREAENGRKGVRVAPQGTVEDPAIEDLRRQVQMKEAQLSELRRR